MGLQINTNITAMFASRNLAKVNSNLEKSLKKLSSGLRITEAAEDAAGLAIASSLKTDINGFMQAQRNINDGVNMIQVADGALKIDMDILSRMKDLAMQSSNASVGSVERTTINNEFSSLRSEIQRLSDIGEFNGQFLLNGALASSAATSVVLQVGLTAASTSQLSLNSQANIGDLDAAGLGLSNLSVTTSSGATTSLAVLDSAINKVVANRGNLGAVQNRLRFAFDHLGITSENYSAARSQIEDVDFATEMANFTKNQILTQAATAMLAQANILPQAVLQLLG
ncbi:MAG: flagellin FliC [Nitrospinae bacterium]|nr:flagellin FliC [Nitrospinota bacterium]